MGFNLWYKHMMGRGSSVMGEAQKLDLGCEGGGGGSWGDCTPGKHLWLFCSVTVSFWRFGREHPREGASLCAEGTDVRCCVWGVGKGPGAGGSQVAAQF